MQNYRSIKVNKGVINRLMLYCMIVWYLLPLVTFKMGTLPVVCMFLIWCVTCNIGRLLNSVSILAPFFVWYLYGLAIYAFGSFYGVEPLYYFTMTLLFAIPSVMYHYYKTENNWKLFKNIRWLTYIVLLIAAINTIRVLITYPMAAKILAMSGIQSEGKEYYSALGCGGYNYVYSIVISFTAILFSRKPTTIWSTLLKVSVLVGSAIAVILSQYTLALLLIIISVIIYFILKLMIKRKTGFVFGIIMIPLLLILLLYVSDVFMWLAKLFANESGISSRLLQVASYLSSGEQGYDLGGRLKLYSASFQTFIHNPLFGIGFFGEGVLGGHSSLIDMLGWFGLCGTIPYIVFCIKNYRMTVTNNKVIITATYITFIILSAMNTTIYSSPIGMMLFFIIPSFTNDYIPSISNVHESLPYKEHT